MARNRPFRTVAGFALLVSAAACLDDTITGTRPLAFSLSATPMTVAVGEAVTFDMSGQGTSVTAIILEFGDGVVDTLTYPAAVEVVDQTIHTYDAPGSYTVRGTLVAFNGRLARTVPVTVN